MVYASWSRGYKPAGLNFNPSAINTPVVFKPETVQSYEVGSKNRFLGNRAELNVAAFYYVYRNFQYTDEGPRPQRPAAPPTSLMPTTMVWRRKAPTSSRHIFAPTPT